MQRTTDHSYESIQQALQITVNNNGDVISASEQSGIPKRTLYTYFRRMNTGQAIRGVHSRRGTSALFRVNEHGQVVFEVINRYKDVPKTLLGTKARVAYQLEQKIRELEIRMLFFSKDIEKLNNELKKLRME